MEEINKEIGEIKRYRRKWYDNHATTYDKVWWESKESEDEMGGFKRLVKIEGGEVILDVAAGTGIFLRARGVNGKNSRCEPKLVSRIKCNFSYVLFPSQHHC